MQQLERRRLDLFMIITGELHRAVGRMGWKARLQMKTKHILNYKMHKNPGNQALSFRSRDLDAVSLATQFEKNKSFSLQPLLLSWDRGQRLSKARCFHSPSWSILYSAIICGAGREEGELRNLRSLLETSVKNADLRIASM